MSKRRRNPASSGGGNLLMLGAVGVGGYFLYEWLTPPAPVVAVPVSTSTALSTTVTTQGAPTSAAVPAGGASPAPVTSGPSLASLLGRINSGVATDPAFTSGSASADKWNYYLNTYYPASSGIDLSTVFPGVDLSQPMTVQTYWAGMAPYLTAHYGLAGLRAGLGAYAAMRGLGQDDTVTEPAGFVGPPTPNPDGSIPTANYPASQSQLAALASQVQAGQAAGNSSTLMYLVLGAGGLFLVALVAGRR